MASPRQLAYKDRFVWLLEQVVSDIFDDCDDFTDRYVFPDMDTRVPLVILLSQREWTTLYSAVLTGADLSYPNTSHDVEFLFLQTVICAMNEFCAAMINCLENDPDVWSALQSLLADNGYTGGLGDPNQPLPETILGDDILPDGYSCTDDKAFGMALAVVNAINDATTEVLQAIEILTNPVEIAAELGDNIPGVGALASAGDVANWIQDSAKEAYDLAWSTTIRDELACLIWCEFKDDCELSFDLIWNIYLNESGASPPGGVLLTDWLAWLVALPFVASLSTVATISLLGLLAMRYGGSFGDFELGIQSLETVMALAEDDSSSDWSTVCDACVTTWCFTWDLTVSQSDWTVDWGTIGLGGLRDEEVDGGGGTTQHAVKLTMDVTGMNVTAVEFNGVHILKLYFVSGWNQAFIWSESNGNILVDPKFDGGPEPYDWVRSGLTGMSGVLQLGIRDGIKATAGGGDISSTDGYVANVTLRGTGSNPFGADNC